MNALVEVDTLSLEGMSEDEGRRLARAFERSLLELLERHGLPEDKHPEDIEAIDLNELPRTTQTPEGLGHELAHALFSELWR